MAKDIEQQVIEVLKKSLYYALQLDESTDVSNCAVLHGFVRFKGTTDVMEELLCSINLPGRIRDILTSQRIFLQEQNRLGKLCRRMY